MRRSTRIRWEIPVLITSLAPGVEFSECCDTVAVNAHGCGIITTTRLEKGIPVKLSLLPNSPEATAHIADVVPLGEDGKSWLLGIQLDEPRNVWGVTSPPEDWNLGAPAADPALTTLSASATVDSSLQSATLRELPRLGQALRRRLRPRRFNLRLRSTEESHPARARVSVSSSPSFLRSH